MIFTPDMNDGRSIFVMGSNLLGVHGKGAALEAVKHWGAKRGQGIGRQGMSYAIPTKRTWRTSLTLGEVRFHVAAFFEYAKANPEFRYLITRIGCGYAGFTDDQIAPMFLKKAGDVNMYLPNEWTDITRWPEFFKNETESA